MFKIIRKNTLVISWIIAVTFIVTIFISWGMNFSGKALMPHMAIVNGKKITADEFQQAYQTKYNNLKDSYGKDFDPESIPDLKKQVLDSLVKENILLAEANRYGITVTEDEVVNGVRSSFQDVNTYNQYIKFAPPLWWKKKEVDVEKEIMMAKLIGAMVDHITLTDGEIDSYYKREYEQAHLLHILISPKKLVPSEDVADYYEKNKEDFMKKGKLKARHILIAVKENANPQEDGAAKTKITDLYNQVKGGTDFAEVAKKNSNCPSAQNGGLAARMYSHGTISSKTAGDIGIIPKRFIPKDTGTTTVAAWKEEIGASNTELDGKITSAAFNLKPVDMTTVIENHLGYHIIKMVGKIPADLTKFDVIKTDVITKSLMEKKSKTYQDWYNGLKKKAKTVITENALYWISGRDEPCPYGLQPFTVIH
ncbi:SurA N-terminal domain-containing protein, partial [Candidatus Desantisbacteria bacterium]|nr:SurA N-terminal domain-containing protein [Candidatus Desantisbacteria bacterium]